MVEDDAKHWWDLVARYRAASAPRQRTMLATAVPLLYHGTANPKLRDAIEAFRQREWRRHYRPDDEDGPVQEIMAAGAGVVRRLFPATSTDLAPLPVG